MRGYLPSRNRAPELGGEISIAATFARVHRIPRDHGAQPVLKPSRPTS